MKIQHVIFTILFAKISVLLLIFLAFSLLPFGEKYYYPNFVYPLHSPITIQTAFKTWDAQHYLYISEKGYKIGNDSNAFPLLFPLAIYLFTFFTRNSFISGIVLSNIFSSVAFLLFYALVKKYYSEKIAYTSLLILLAFPTSFYFCLIYSESLFFLLVMLFFTFLQKRQIFLASLAAFLLPLTRLIGVAISIPFLFSYILEYKGHSLYDEIATIGKSLLNTKTFLLLSPFLGVGTAMICMYLFTGNFFTQFSAQQNFVSHYSLGSLLNPLFFFKALFTFPLRIHGFTDSLLDRVFFLGFLLSLPLVFKKVTKVFFVYTILFGLLPVLSGSFMSYMRYLVVVFPIFIAGSLYFSEKKYTSLYYPFLFLLLLLQGLFIIMHSLNYWVA
ncbi:MAG TPA: hypothetical protein VEW42_06710 [Candidatus Eisenbacteria bacterium]|nr:hypothetical protein [Candidatus Eisenbacteria bacterium]